MKLDRFVFVGVLTLAVVVAMTAWWPAADGDSGAHPRFSSMRHGGSGVERHGEMLWLGWLLGTTIISLFVSLIAFGARKRLRKIGRWLLLGAIGYLTLWTAVVLAYRRYLDSVELLESGAGEPPLFLALPAPTALMLYVMWPATTFFLLLFAGGFKRWVLTDDDLARYEQLVAEKRARSEVES